MLTITANKISTHAAIVDVEQLREVVRKAQMSEEVNLIEIENDLPIEGVMGAVEKGHSIDFLSDQREDIYTVNDLKVKYQ